jgi:hypothetical protein
LASRCFACVVVFVLKLVCMGFIAWATTWTAASHGFLLRERASSRQN